MGWACGASKMSKCIFMHRSDSPYDDLPEEQYQFPSTYFNRAKPCEGDWIAYYEPKSGGGRLGYFAIAKVKKIIPDPKVEKMFVAVIEPNSYRDLGKFVPYKNENGFVESLLQKEDGSLNGGYNVWAIRPICDEDFQKILDLGYPKTETLLPRVDEDQRDEAPGFYEEQQPFVIDNERERIEQTISKIPRDKIFRKNVLTAYEERCAITGLQLLNGGGRAEVEAAHIKPVKYNGPDTIRNGIALSGTAHWMFDRGLISVSDQHEILVSRHTNNPDQIHNLINKTGNAIVPENPAHHPHPKYLAWHRENCFKH